MATKKATPKMEVPQFGEVPQQITEMMTTMTRMQGHMFDTIMRQNIEVLDFLKARFERDRSLMTELTKTEDPGKASKLWSDFMQQAMSDYSEETGKLTGMMAELTADAVKRLNDEAYAAMKAAQPA